MNWVLLIEDIMLKSHRLVDYEFLYVMLASRFIDYFNINVSNEITKRRLKKLVKRFFEHEWNMDGEPPATANIDQMEKEAKDEAQQELAHQ